MNKRKAYILATVTYVITLFAIVVVYATLFPATIPTTGKYSGTISVTLTPASIDWGTTELNVPKTKNVQIENIGTQHIEHLTMYTTNLDGLTPSDFDLTWNLEGQPLEVGMTITASFTLTITSPVSSSFTFDIVIDEA